MRRIPRRSTLQAGSKVRAPVILPVAYPTDGSPVAAAYQQASSATVVDDHKGARGPQGRGARDEAAPRAACRCHARRAPTARRHEPNTAAFRSRSAPAGAGLFLSLVSRSLPQRFLTRRPGCPRRAASAIRFITPTVPPTRSTTSRMARKPTSATPTWTSRPFRAATARPTASRSTRRSVREVAVSRAGPRRP